MSAKQRDIDRSDDGPLCLLKKLINNLRITYTLSRGHETIL